MPNCSIAANSTSESAIALDDSTSSLAAATLVTAGEVSLQRNPINPAAPPSEIALGSPARIGAPIVPDPYEGTLTHAFLTTGMPTVECAPPSGSLTVYNTGNCVFPLPGLIVYSGNTVDLAPGTYWVNGDLTVPPTGVLKCSTCDNVNGIGVTIILTTKTSNIGYVAISDATFNLNAPSSGQFSGVVLVQDANGIPPSHGSKITGGPSATLNGLVYFPKSSMTFHANPSSTGPKCLVLVINWLNVDANSNLDVNGCANAGLANLPTVNTAALAE
jgi:hypothetical protein